MQDINKNEVSDFQDAIRDLQQTQEYQAAATIDQEKINMQRQSHADKMSIERQKLATQQQIAQTQLQIAQENKNKYDAKKDKSTTNKKKK
jgi:hypothetical protein